MKRILLILSLSVFFISCKSEKQKETPTETDIPVLALSEFESQAGAFVGKEIQIKGIVDHVCKHGGKRLLLVDDMGDVHVDSDKRFDEALTGSEILVTGTVREFRVDEGYCLQKEADHIQKHKEGADPDSVYAKKIKQINFFRDSMKSTGKDHLSFYSIDYISHELPKQ